MFFIPWAALTFKAVDAGAGTHQWNLSVRDLAHQYRVCVSKLLRNLSNSSASSTIILTSPTRRPYALRRCQSYSSSFVFSAPNSEIHFIGCSRASTFSTYFSTGYSFSFQYLSVTHGRRSGQRKPLVIVCRSLISTLQVRCSTYSPILPCTQPLSGRYGIYKCRRARNWEFRQYLPQGACQ